MELTSGFSSPAMDARPQLPPGFRFEPTDAELVVHYLRRRALGVPLPAGVDISDVRILAHEPSDLLPPGWAEPERYLYTRREAKYRTGCRANRATGAGYWKNTGKEKPVFAGAGGQAAVLVRMRRSLVFYRGSPPTGTKTDWMVHEYRLAGAGLLPWRRSEGWLLCRVFRKTGSAVPVVEVEEEEEAVVEDTEQEEEDEDAAPAAGFIDFFARAEAAQQQQQGRGSLPVVSSSCLTDE